MKFETINNQLCRMVEPTPLTPESKFPCVVRLIQDETMIGKANIRACHPKTLASKRICSELTDDGLFMDGNYTYRYEIIGYPVEEGSAEWALWQAENGKSFEHKTAHHCRIFTMFSETELRVTNEEGEVVEFVDIDRFLSEGAKDGWQLCEPKPLLADAKVGDLCQRRDGKWVQICEVHGNSVFKYQNPIKHTHIIICDETGDTEHWGKVEDADIIATEPLAPEGSAEWAWQMLILQKPVSHPAEGIRRDTYFSKDGFVHYMAKTGWHLYEEPEYKVGDWVEFRDIEGIKHGIIEGRREEYSVLCNGISQSVGDKFITRKLDPSEVIVNIGCLKGTVTYAVSNDCFLLAKVYDPQHRACCIDMSMLDTATRELVESLLKAQEEK